MNQKYLTLIIAGLVVPPAYANCPTAGAYSGVQLIGQTGCSYADSSLSNSGGVAVIDIQQGGSATFTASDITLHKASGGYSDGTYAAIFLRPESDVSKTNQAVFEGNVTVNEAAASRFPRDIIVSGGGDLLIKGDLTVNHGRSGGGIINVNAQDGGWYVAGRSDTKMRVEGKTSLNINGSGGTTAVRLGDGSLTFAGDVAYQSNQAAGENFVLQHDGSKLTFEKSVDAQVNQNFLQTTGTNSQIYFNDKLTVNNSGSQDTFTLGNSTTHLNGNTEITAANAGAFRLHSTAILNNNGTLTATTKDGIAIHAAPTAGETIRFNNQDNGVVNQTAGVGRNNGAGTFEVNNSGILSSDTADVFANTANGTININNSKQLTGSLNKAGGTLSLNNAAGATWTTSSARDSVLSNIENLGTIAFAPVDLSIDSARTITTDQYTGGGTLIMNTQWNDDAALGDNGRTVSDKLIITQINGTGVTTVRLNAPNIGSITPKASDIHSDDVIEVGNAHTGNLFVGTVNTAGTQQAQLAKNGNNYHWTLKANNGADLVNPDAVSYLQTTQLSLGMGWEHIGMLHQRIGSQYHNGSYTTSGSHHQDLWMRWLGSRSQTQGRDRFGADSKTIGLQIGHNLHTGQSASGGRHYSGLMLAYSHGNHRLYDKYRSISGIVAADKYTGQSHTDIVSISGYHTRYSQTGAYVDFVGQLSWLRNRHSQATQHGLATALSAEIGKPYSLANNWYIEPQAQLVYQYQHLNATTDNVGRQIHSNNTHRLTARVGTRLLWSNGNKDAYVLANIIRPIGNIKTTIDGSTLHENFNTWQAQVGLGGQWQLTPALHLYADARYTRSLGKGNTVWRNSNSRFSAYSGNVGLRFTW